MTREKHDHHAKQHRRQLDVLHLFTGQFDSGFVDASHLAVNLHVEFCNETKWNEIHEDEIKPVDVDRDVKFVFPEI